MNVYIDKTSVVLIVAAMFALVLLGWTLKMEKHKSEMDYIMTEVIAATESLEKCNEYMDIFERMLDEKETP